ncbi:MAG TPA: hypothetical protein VGA36_11475 [Nitriliruptorales bacterium]|jgi:hypothetical protein
MNTRTARRLLERFRQEDDGFTTAELLGNAALGIVALVVIWAGLQSVGVDVVDLVRQQILGG